MLNDVDYRLDANLVAREGVLIAVESKVRDYVRAIPALSLTPEGIVIEDVDDLSQRLDEVAGDHAPLLIVVRIVSAHDKAHGIPGALRLDPLTLEVAVYENITVNRGAYGTGLTRNKAAELLAKHLKCRRVGNSYLTAPAIADAHIPDHNTDRLLGKTVAFTLVVDV